MPVMVVCVAGAEAPTFAVAVMVTAVGVPVLSTVTTPVVAFTVAAVVVSLLQVTNCVTSGNAVLEPRKAWNW